MPDLQVLCFGDSSTYGAWDFEEGGWVHRLRKYVDGKRAESSDYFGLVYNLGISGGTSETLLERLGVEMQARMKEEERDSTTVIIATGANDSTYINDKERNRVPPDDFAKNIDKIIAKAKPVAKHLGFVGLRDFDETKVDPIPWRPGWSYLNKYQREYDEIIETACHKHEVAYLEVDELSDRRFLDQDGVHLNAEGHQRQFEIIRDYLEQNNLI